MPIYELQGPDGKTYEVDAPDMRAAANAFSGMAPASVGDMSVRNVATAAARGVPVLGGLVDEAIAGGQTLFGNGSYADNLKAEQDRQKAFDDQNPWVSGGAQLAGGVAGTIPMVMAAPAAFGAGAAGWGARAIASMISGGLIGGADQAVRTNGDPMATFKGAAVGGGAGLAGPAVGRGLGKAYEATANYLRTPTNALTGISPRAANYAAKTIGTPERQAAVRTQLDALGPEGMLADVSPEWMMAARGAAARPGQRDMIVNPLLNRDVGKNLRLGEDLNASLGRPGVPSTINAEIEAGQRALGPAYGEAFRGASPVDTRQLAFDMDQLAGTLRGDARQAVVRARQMLNTPGKDALDPSPQGLFQTRQALDGMLATENNPQVVRYLTEVRQRVDGELAAAVPGIKDVDAQFAELARQREALAQGSKVLDSGKTAIRPQEMAAEMQTGALPQGAQVGPSAVPFRIQQGTRAEMDRLVGQAANDPAKLQQVVRSEGDWNRDKLRTVFGQERADDALRAIDRETTFYRTKNDVVGNSHTAATQGYREMLDDAGRPNTIPVETSAFGAGMRGLQWLFTGSAKDAAAKKAEKFAGDLGRLAVARGADRDAIVQSIIDMITQQQGRAPVTRGVEQATNALLRAGAMQVPGHF